MKSSLPIEAKRFKLIRQELNFTQIQFAKQLNLPSSTVDIERGKTRITGETVALLMEIFKINPLWLFGKSSTKHVTTNTFDVMPKVVTLDENSGQENMLMVNQKAAAGYPSNIQDTSWYKKLPAFNMPIPEFRNATYRGFQVDGDSMLPSLYPGDWVLAKSLDQLTSTSSKKMYVVVLDDSVLVKKISIHPNRDELILISTNQLYPPIFVEPERVLEVWEVTSKLTFSLDANAENSVLKKLEDSMEELKSQLKAIK
jgi:transcriptional regulator with XRE-family HTH domain